MEWYELPKEEVEHYNNLNQDELKNIMQQGLQSEFWKLMRVHFYNSLRSADMNLKRKKVETQDDLFALGKWNAIYKTNEEMFSWPENVINTIINMKTSPVTSQRR